MDRTEEEAADGRRAANHEMLGSQSNAVPVHIYTLIVVSKPGGPHLIIVRKEKQRPGRQAFSVFL